MAGSADADTLRALDDFADALGLAFQVRDDILDVEASSEQLGKTAGKDAAQAKSTYPALLGMDGAKAKLVELDCAMREALAPCRACRPRCAHWASWRSIARIELPGAAGAKRKARLAGPSACDVSGCGLLDQAQRERIAIGFALVGLHRRR